MMIIKPFHIQYMLDKCGLFNKYPFLCIHQRQVISFILCFASGRSQYQQNAKYFTRRMCFDNKPEEKKNFLEYLEIKVCHNDYSSVCSHKLINFVLYAKCDLTKSKIVHFLEDFCDKPLAEILNHFVLINMTGCKYGYGYQSKFDAYLKYHGDIIRKIFDMHLIVFLAKMMSYIELAMETNTIHYLDRIYKCGINLQNTKHDDKIIFQTFFDFIPKGLSSNTIFEDSHISSYIKKNFLDASNVIKLTKKLYSKLEFLYRFFISQDLQQIKAHGQINTDFNLIVGNYTFMKSYSINKFVAFKNLLLLHVIDDNISFVGKIDPPVISTFSDQLVLEI